MGDAVGDHNAEREGAKGLYSNVAPVWAERTRDA